MFVITSILFLKNWKCACRSFDSFKKAKNQVAQYDDKVKELLNQANMEGHMEEMRKCCLRYDEWDLLVFFYSLIKLLL